MRIAADLDDVPTPDVPVLPLPVLELPDVDSLSEIPDVVDLAFPGCASWGRTGIALRVRSWALSDDHPVLPDAEAVTALADALCHDVALPQRVRFSDDSIKISLPLAHRPHGQPFTDEACGGTELIVIELDEPVGNRSLAVS